MKKLNYKSTSIACYLAYVVQAIVCNFAPLLFVTFNKQFNISITKITSIISVTFVVQIIVDLLSTLYVDKIGYKVSIVLSHIFSCLGFIMLGTLPFIIDPFVGIIISVIVYSVGSGLLEVLVSPIIESCPGKNKRQRMSFLHSFYCWGTVFVILVSTLFFSVFSINNWRYLIIAWAILPLLNGILFVFVPININHEKETSTKSQNGSLFKNKLFYILLVLMMMSGASELAMSQWASAFAETGLNISKTAGDLAGPCMFAFVMGLSRIFYSIVGKKVDLKIYMIISSLLCITSFVLTSLSSNPVLSLIGCGLCGISVGVMWPGTISLGAKYIKTGGTQMFGLLALAGDLGCTAGPSIIGLATNKMGSVKDGLIFGIIFPIILLLTFCSLYMFKKGKIK